VKVSLLIASFGDSETVNLPLIQLTIPSSAARDKKTLSPREKQEIDQGFARRLERRHTFNVPATDQMPPKLVSLVAALITLALPSIVLALLVRERRMQT
jgi:hypothetical protein